MKMWLLIYISANFVLAVIFFRLALRAKRKADKIIEDVKARGYEIVEIR